MADSSPDPTPSAIRTLGFTLLYSSLSRLPAPLLHRLHLKLPSDANPAFDRLTVEPFDRSPDPTQRSNDPTIQRSNDPSNDSTVKRSNGQTISPTTIKLLLKLRFPEAHALCFS